MGQLTCYGHGGFYGYADIRDDEPHDASDLRERKFDAGYRRMSNPVLTRATDNPIF